MEEGTKRQEGRGGREGGRKGDGEKTRRNSAKQDQDMAVMRAKMTREKKRQGGRKKQEGGQESGKEMHLSLKGGKPTKSASKVEEK